MRLEHSIDIAAPVERVWQLTIDVETWPRHTPTITKVERVDSGPIGIGSMARIKQPAQRTKTWTVEALEPEKRFVWSTKTLGTTLTGGHHLHASETGTTNTLTVDIDGRLAFVLGAVLRRPLMKAITLENEGLKSAAED